MVLIIADECLVLFALGWNWSRLFSSRKYIYPASLGRVRNPGSGLAQCRLALLTNDIFCFTKSRWSIQSLGVKI